jgi:hypothetical protein
MVDGEVVVDEFSLTQMDPDEVAASAAEATREIVARAGI